MNKKINYYYIQFMSTNYTDKEWKMLNLKINMKASWESIVFSQREKDMLKWREESKKKELKSKEDLKKLQHKNAMNMFLWKERELTPSEKKDNKLKEELKKIRWQKAMNLIIKDNK